MQTFDLCSLLSNNEYPGRGIVTGVTPDGTRAFIAYFIMGRSANSRNRVFAADGDGLITRAFDKSKVEDPSLIIYAPVRTVGDKTVVTNGDQTDTIAGALKVGGTFEGALRTREFEPDAPNFTPRISALVNGDGSFKMSILKSADCKGGACARYTFEYPAEPGAGRFIHTYVGNGDPIPAFEGEPERVSVENDLDAFTDKIWQSLNADNKISLFTRTVDLASGKTETRIINKNR